MAVIKSQCPSCRKILKLKTRAALGKRVPCPGCQKPFTVEVYQAPVVVEDFLEPEDEGETFDYQDYEGSAGSGGQEYDDYGDDYGDDYDDEYGDDDYGDDYDAAPRRSASRSGSSSRKSSRGGSGKKKKSSGKKGRKKKSGLPAWFPLAMIALAALLAVGGVAGLLFTFLPGGSSNPIDLTWVQDDAEMIMQIKPQELVNARVLDPLRDNPLITNLLNSALTAADQLPFELSEISMVTIAVSNVQGSSGSDPLAGIQQGFSNQNTSPLIVVRLSRDIQESDLENQAGVERQDQNGTAYFTLGTNAAFLADGRTLITGSRDMVTAAIDRGPVAPRLERIDFIDPDHQLLVVMAPENPEQSDNSSGDAIKDSLDKNARGMYLGLSLDSDINLEVGVDCYSSTQSSEIKSDIEAALQEASPKIDEGAAGVPAPMQKLVSIATQSFKSISVSTSGSTATITGSIPGEIGPALAELANNPLAAMALGGLSGGGLGNFSALGGFGGATPPPGRSQNPGPGSSPGTGSSSGPGSSPGFGQLPQTASPGQGGTPNPLTGALDAARKSQSKNNLKQLMLGAHNYHAVHGKFPQSAITGPDGKTTHSWRVALLPFIGQKKLYDQYQLNEPWDSPANQAVLNQMPAVFRHPNDLAGSTNAAYFGLVGPDTAMGDTSRQARLRDITDGTANTIFLVEARRKIPWTKPEDIAYTAQAAIPQFGGYHNGGFHAALADGSVRFLADSLDQNTLRNAINARDGNPVNLNVGIPKAAGLKTAWLHTQPVPFEQHSRWGLESAFRDGKSAVPGRARAGNPTNRISLPATGRFVEPGRSPG